MLKAEMSTASSPNLSCSRNMKVPSDFASYLLAASPPSTTFYMNQQLFAKGCSQVITAKVVRCNKIVTSSSKCDFNDITINDLKVTPKSKRKVKFADEIAGGILAKVHEFVEKSCEPPQLSVCPEIDSEDTSKDPYLVIEFKQPAADYIGFRNKLHALNVSLENFIVKKLYCTGTIKVKNLSFAKKVFLRATFDDWSTYEDFGATYVPRGPFPTTNEFDTFSFDLWFPENNVSQKLEFCVCFMSENTEFWDNNGDCNYVISKSSDSEKVLNNNSMYSGSIFDTRIGWKAKNWNNAAQDIPYW